MVSPEVDSKHFIKQHLAINPKWSIFSRVASTMAYYEQYLNLVAKEMLYNCFGIKLLTTGLLLNFQNLTNSCI